MLSNYLSHKQKTGFLLTACTLLFLSAPLSAQDNPALVVDLITRVGAIETDNRELRGQLEEARHEISQLTQRMETISSDVDYRLNSPESGAPVSLTPPGLVRESRDEEPAPLASEKIEKLTPSSSSTTTEEYEKARSYLEQGDYAAAEHAFSAFVSAHPKDDHVGAAQYWLGVTYAVRGEHEKAVAAFAKGYKNYPKSSKASDALLKLAKSLRALDRKADACAALDQLSSEHPKKHVKEVAEERKQSGC